MPARCLPERPRFKSRAEKVAFHALASKLRDVDVLLANVRFTGLDGDWEVDLVVGMPDAGFAAIEVKGGHVWREAGTWWQQTPQGKKSIDLEDQATSGKYLLRRYLRKHAGWTHGELPSIRGRATGRTRDRAARKWTDRSGDGRAGHCPGRSSAAVVSTLCPSLCPSSPGPPSGGSRRRS